MEAMCTVVKSTGSRGRGTVKIIHVKKKKKIIHVSIHSIVLENEPN